MIRLLRSALLMLFLLAGPVYADDSPEPPQSQILIHQGVTGMWFPMPVARRLLTDVEQIPALRTQISSLERSLELCRESRTMYMENAEWSEQQAHAWHKALLESLEVSASTRPGFWESNELWFFTGFLSAAVLSIGLTFGLSSADGA